MYYATAVQFESDTQRDAFVTALAVFVQDAKSNTAFRAARWVRNSVEVGALVDLLDHEWAVRFRESGSADGFRTVCADFMLWLMAEYPHLIG